MFMFMFILGPKWTLAMEAASTIIISLQIVHICANALVASLLRIIIDRKAFKYASDDGGLYSNLLRLTIYTRSQICHFLLILSML